MSGHAAPLALEREADSRRPATPAAAAPQEVPAPPPAAAAPTPPSGAAEVLTALPPRLKISGAAAARRTTAVLPSGAGGASQPAAGSRAVMQESRMPAEWEPIATPPGPEPAESQAQAPSDDVSCASSIDNDAAVPEPAGAGEPAQQVAAPPSDSARFSREDGSHGDEEQHAQDATTAWAAETGPTLAQAVNDRIDRLPEIGSLAELSQAVLLHLRERLRAGQGTRLVLLGHSHADRVEDTPTGLTLLRAALQAKARVRGAKRLLLQCSPHHGEGISPGLVHGALRCGFGVRGHDTLGLADPATPAYRLDARERAMADAVSDALRESVLVVASCRTPHLPALHAAISPAVRPLVVALVARVADDDESGARRLRTLLNQRTALCLKAAPALEQPP